MHLGWQSRDLVFPAGASAVLCGLLFMGLTGAPPRLLLINLVALGVGAALVAIARLLPPRPPAVRSAALLGIAAALLGTAMFGISSQGASRWIAVGGLSLQPGLILVPVLLFAHVSRADRWSSAAVVLAALAMALQPDRSLAGAIAAVLLVDASVRRSPLAWAIAVLSLAAFVGSMLQPDLLPAVPWVDQILWTPLVSQPLAAMAVWTGTLLLFLPALRLWRGGEGASAAAFVTLWGTLVVSAGLHNYPTPLVGYGASCILGYLLAAITLPDGLRSAKTRSSSSRALEPGAEPPASWRVRPSTL